MELRIRSLPQSLSHPLHRLLRRLLRRFLLRSLLLRPQTHHASFSYSTDSIGVDRALAANQPLD